MVRTQLQSRDIRDPEVLRAMGKVPRHEFVLPSDWDEAYADHPVGIGCGQTISQPYIVAYMTQVLQVEAGMKVLEIGTGSGYQTAVLSVMNTRVFTVERHAPLSEQARQLLVRIGYAGNIKFRVGDGTLGWAGEEPFDRIIVTAAAPTVPQALKEQLAIGGRMVIPAGRSSQQLKIVTRTQKGWRTRNDLGVIFVKLIGEQGFSGR